MAKNILITGASGKLGNFVAPYLQDQGYNITCTDIVTPILKTPNAACPLSKQTSASSAT